MVATVNATGSKYESYVDGAMDYCEKQASAFERYVKSAVGKERVNMVEKVATLAIAALFCMSSPMVVLSAAAVGVAIRVFSPEQLASMQKSISTIWNSMPFHVKALGLTVLMLNAPYVFPAYAGLAAGLELGTYVPAGAVVSALDKATK